MTPTPMVEAVAGTSAHEARSAGLMACARLLRLHQWPKNLFVFAPLMFSGRLIEIGATRSVFLSFLALCWVSSGAYVINDIHDRHADAEHPLKRQRPIAAGLISVPAAVGLSACLIALGGAALRAAHVSPVAWGLAAGYLALCLAYSFYLKRKVLADVLTIAAGYVIRVLVGGAAIGVAVTHWLVLCTFLLALFLGFSKRRHELAVLGENGRRHRQVLSLYNEAFLDRVSLLTLAMTLTCYVLYTISPETTTRFGTDALVYSSVIVMYGLFRYLFLIHVKGMGSPVEILYYDRQIVFAVVMWLLYTVSVIYTWPAMSAYLR